MGYNNPDPDESTIKMPVADEELELQVKSRRRGLVRIHKRVESQPVAQPVELHHEDVTVDRVRKDEIVTERREPWWENGVLMVPVYEEEVITQTRLVLREVVQVKRIPRAEQVTVEGELRREVVDIERIDE